MDVVERYLDTLYADIANKRGNPIGKHDGDAGPPDAKRRPSAVPTRRLSKEKVTRVGNVHVRTKPCKRKGENPRKNAKHTAKNKTRLKWRKRRANHRGRRVKNKGRAGVAGSQYQMNMWEETGCDSVSDTMAMNCVAGCAENAEKPGNPLTEDERRTTEMSNVRVATVNRIPEDSTTNLLGEEPAARILRTIAEDVARALNIARREPRHFIPLVSAKSPREGGSLVAETVEFLQNRAPAPHSLRYNPYLSGTCAEAIRLLAGESARHTGSLMGFARTHGLFALSFGEMFWSSAELPQSGFDIVSDFLLDDGVLSRSHRNGIFDDEFHEFGIHVARIPSGEFVAFLHFADLCWPQPADASGVDEKEGIRRVCPSKPPTEPDCGHTCERGRGAWERKGTFRIGMKRESEERNPGERFIDLTFSPERVGSPKNPRLSEPDRPRTRPHHPDSDSLHPRGGLAECTDGDGAISPLPHETTSGGNNLILHNEGTRHMDIPHAESSEAGGGSRTHPDVGRKEGVMTRSPIRASRAPFPEDAEECPLRSNVSPETGARLFPQNSLAGNFFSEGNVPTDERR